MPFAPFVLFVSVTIPLVFIAPPDEIVPDIPIPPTTTSAPEVVVVLAVPDAATKLPFEVVIPLDVNVVNAPVPGVTLPIACACNAPVVIVENVVVPENVADVETFKFEVITLVANKVLTPEIFPLLPDVIKLPTYTLPLMPAPPTTTNAPVVVLELAVPDAATKLPFDVITPDAVIVDPVFTAPLIPNPPTTTNAPVVVLELAVPDAATTLPLAINVPDVVAVVNAPVLGVNDPIGVLLMFEKKPVALLAEKTDPPI